LSLKAQSLWGAPFNRWAGRDQSVKQLATGWTGPRIKSRLGGCNFPHPPRPALYNGHWVFPGGKAVGAWPRLKEAYSCTSNPFNVNSSPILILSQHLRLGLLSGLFPLVFPTKTLYAPLLSHISAT